MKSEPAAERSPLTRESIVAAAMALADEEGVDQLSMRRLAATLDHGAMSLYNYVGNKEQLLDAMVDAVFAGLPLPAADGGWRAAIRERAVAIRAAFARHRWAIGLLESRSSPGPATLAHHDAVLGSLRAGGLSLAGAVSAYSVIDSYIFGYTMNQTAMPFDTPEETAQLARSMLAEFPVEQFPNLAAVMTELVIGGGYDYAGEYEQGLDLVLDAIERTATR